MVEFRASKLSELHVTALKDTTLIQNDVTASTSKTRETFEKSRKSLEFIVNSYALTERTKPTPSMEKLKHVLHLKRDGKWTSLQHWLLCFIVCHFNVDVGPEIELVYPPDTNFSTSDLSAICFNSFPERQDSEFPEDAHFHFTIRNSSPDISLHSPSAPFGSSSLLFGSSVFRQEFDSVTKRSFSQRALVIISSHEFSSFFAEILRIVTKTEVISDPTRLEVACSEISKWPPPVIGRQRLPFLGTVLELEMCVVFDFVFECC